MAASHLRLLLLATGLCLCSTMQIRRTFRDPSGNNLQHIALHSQTGNIYLGATNRVHKLSSELTLIQSASTGPREDNSECPPPLLPCKEEKRQTDSQTKGLVIDTMQNSLILCSSLFHGFCQKLSLKNITHVDKFIHKALVPNDDSSSSVMFIAPGVDAEPALYIAATYSNNGLETYRNIVPSLSSRQLSNLDFTYRDPTGGSKKSVLESFRKSFKIRFVDGFSHEGFVYFLSVHKEAVNSTVYVSKISRICQEDKYFYSYVEVPFFCGSSSGKQYNIVQGVSLHDEKLYAVFMDDVHVTGQPPRSSAFCQYDMDNIAQLFNQTVSDCFQGRGTIGPEFYTQKYTCKQTAAPVDVCAQSDVAEAYSSIEGSTPVKSTPSLELPSTEATSVLVQQDGRHLIGYVGTHLAEILKVLIQTDQASIVDSLETDARGPVKAIVQSNLMEEIIVLTPTKLVLVTTHHCEERTTCDDCMTVADDICGWCVMQDRCTSADSCKSSAVKPHWLPSSDQSCASIKNIQPEMFSFEGLDNKPQSKEITFELDHVAVQQKNSGDLKCMFVAGKTKHGTQASLQNDRITCPLPAKNHLPSIPHDHQDLVLQFHVQGRSIVTRSVSVYDCRVHQNCTGCTSSSFNCQWCPASNTCIKDSSSCQSGTPVSASGSCPRIQLAAGDTDILVHSGEEKQIAVRVQNLQGDQSKNMQCHFSYLQEKTVVPGTIQSSSLTCQSVKFNYSESLPYVTASFKVTSGQNDYPLDNPSGIKVRIYKCPLMVTNCGKCLSMDAEYSCGWCEYSCTLQKNCPGNWLDRSETCRKPQILRFSPANGPIQGKTNISVTGINLGKAYTDITDSVTVAGVKCSVHPDHYEPSSRFMCETDKPSSLKSGTIKVLVDGKYTAESDTPFHFVVPLVQDLTPEKGPKSGGTALTITGLHMNTGSSSSVSLAGAPCEVLRSNKTVIVCKTSQHVANDDAVEVEVNFGGLKKLVPKKFTYITDPSITMIEPKSSILSGGTSITVMGQDLDLIQNPIFFTTHGGEFFKTKCHHVNKFQMQCPVPGIPTPGLNVSATSPLEVHYGFHMDGVMTLKNISHLAQFGPLIYLPDPVIYQFPGETHTKKFIQNDLISIKGEFHSINPLMSNVVVYVGDDECGHPAATDTAITCHPPKAPAGIDDSTGKAMVKVQIGNINRDVGYLEYYDVSGTDKPIALGVILGVVLPIIAIIVLLTICVIRRHRKHGPSENYIPDVLKDYEGKKEEEEIGMNHVSVKADMNGQMTDDKDSGPYIAELLGTFEDSALRQNISSMLIARSRLDIGELIGKGNFGAVYKAQYQRNDDEKPVQVAVKTLQGKNTEAEAMQTFLQDTVLLKDLHHPNILAVVGVCITASDDPTVIMPFMATEDLKNYIREPSKNITVLELVDFARQISEGMAYLEGVKVVHRNLAARNCIVTAEKTILLTEYGITRALFPREYYFGEDSNVKVLYKWMAPEVLEDFDFTSRSDVWAFGVVMWELLTRGVTPYPDVESSDLPAYLKGGKRMKKPKQCPENIYQMMLTCWSENAADRPTFQTLQDQLKTSVQSDEGMDEGEESKPLMSNVEIGGSTEYLEVIG